MQSPRNYRRGSGLPHPFLGIADHAGRLIKHGVRLCLKSNALTPSIRHSMTDMKPDALGVLQSGRHRYPLADPVVVLPLSTGMLLAPPRDPRPRVTACGSWVLDAATGVTDSTEDERVRGAAVRVNPPFKQVEFDSVGGPVPAKTCHSDSNK